MSWTWFLIITNIVTFLFGLGLWDALGTQKRTADERWEELTYIKGQLSRLRQSDTRLVDELMRRAEQRLREIRAEYDRPSR